MLDHFTLVSNFQDHSGDLKIIKSFDGEINQDLVKDFTEEMEEKLDVNPDDVMINKRVFHVMVELLQNVCKHAEDESVKTPNVGKGVFILATDDKNYYVKTGNMTKTEEIEKVIDKINGFNSLDTDELKAKYKELIKASRISEKGGAGLGIIDIIKKTKNKIECTLEKKDDEFSFFIQQATINII